MLVSGRQSGSQLWQFSATIVILCEELRYAHIIRERPGNRQVKSSVFYAALEMEPGATSGGLAYFPGAHNRHPGIVRRSLAGAKGLEPSSYGFGDRHAIVTPHPYKKYAHAAASRRTNV